MQFKDVKRFQPVIYGGDKPHKHDLFHHNWLDIPLTETKYIKYLKDNNVVTDRSWWKKQHDRCTNGFVVEDAIEKGGDALEDNIECIWVEDDCYLRDFDYTIKDKNVWISGRMYFYLNFWVIKRVDEQKKIKTVGPPRFTQLSFENWLIRDLSRKRGYDLLWAKRRQCGASEEAACDLAYDYLFIKDYQGVIVAGEEKYAVNTFNMVKRGITRIINTQFYKWSSVANQEVLKAKYFGSEIHCRTARDNEQSLSGLTPSKVLYEEVGIWKKGKVRDTLEFVNQSLEAEGVKTGQNIFISTAGDMEEGVADVEYMFYNPEQFNLMPFVNRYENEETSREFKVARFIPGWKFEIIDENGNSLKAKSIDKLNKDRESKDTKEKYRSITQKPFHPSELFSIVGGAYFGQHIIHMLNERKAYLYTHKHENKGDYYKLAWIDINDWSKGVTTTKDEEGEFFIIEHPDLDKEGIARENIYKIGLDPYDKDEAVESTSKGSMHVFKGFRSASSSYKMYVARLIQRPSIDEGGAYKFYENSVKLCIYYNGINLIEWSNIRIFYYYQQNNVEWLLKERPDLVMSKYIANSKTNNTYGIDPSTKPHWLAMLKDYLSYKENVNKLFDIEQIEAFAKFRYVTGTNKGQYNCDATISSALAVVCYEDEIELETVEKELSFEKIKQNVPVFIENEWGILERRII